MTSRDGLHVTDAGTAFRRYRSRVSGLGFAFGSTHWFGGQVASFSAQHRVSPDIYAAAFVLMVLVMIVVRTAAVIIRGYAARAGIDWTRLPVARRRLGA